MEFKRKDDVIFILIEFIDKVFGLVELWRKGIGSKMRGSILGIGIRG